MKYDPKLIIDVGVCEGEDSDFYLKKGFNVVAVEADGTLIEGLETRFREAVDSRRLRILHRAVAEESGRDLEFWRNVATLGHSSLNPDHGAGAKERSVVRSIAWPELKGIAGLPYFLKIDVEGAEAPFLNSMAGDPDLPPLISVEAHTFEPISILHGLGYRYFKLVNQTILQTLPLPDPALEGSAVVTPDWRHCSGTFGRELPGPWSDFPEISRQFDMIQALKSLNAIFQPWVWFDCHASLHPVG